MWTHGWNDTNICVSTKPCSHVDRVSYWSKEVLKLEWETRLKVSNLELTNSLFAFRTKVKRIYLKWCHVMEQHCCGLSHKSLLQRVWVNGCVCVPGSWWRSGGVHRKNVEVTDLWNRSQEDRTGEIKMRNSWVTSQLEFCAPSDCKHRSIPGQLPCVYVRLCEKVRVVALLSVYFPSVAIVKEGWAWTFCFDLLLFCGGTVLIRGLINMLFLNEPVKCFLFVSPLCEGVVAALLWEGGHCDSIYGLGFDKLSERPVGRHQWRLRRRTNLIAADQNLIWKIKPLISLWKHLSLQISTCWN